MIEIRSNGSKWMGQAPDPVEVLIDVLGRERLNYEMFSQAPTFESVEAGGVVHFFGNFLGVSHVFNIRTDEPDLIRQLRQAIAANREICGGYIDRTAPAYPHVSCSARAWSNGYCMAHQAEAR